MNGMAVKPEPYAPFPEGEYMASEHVDGTIHIQHGDTQLDNLTRGEFEALFKKKVTE